MYEFVDRLFSVALPRVRDFRGINGNSFDGRGNYAVGIKEQLIFPEIDYDKICLLYTSIIKGERGSRPSKSRGKARFSAAFSAREGR